jgi:hypothetical protein
MPAKSRTKAQKNLRTALTTSVDKAKSTMLGTTKVKPSEMREALAVYFDKAKYDPIKDLISAAQDKETPIKERIGIHKEFLKYMAPSLKSIDIQQHTDMNIQVIVRKFGEDIDI